MIVGVPKEIKKDETRVPLTPGGVEMLSRGGHQVLVERGAGAASGFLDDQYVGAGAVIVDNAADVFGVADMVVKVKEPLPSEFGYFREGQVLFTFLHLAAAPALTRALMESKVVGIAYETVQTADGALPLLLPMSEVAGRMAVQIGTRLMENAFGGKGVLLGGVPGVAPAEVVIVGGGIVGTNAAKIALGLGAHVTVFDISGQRLRYLDDVFHRRVTTIVSNPINIAEYAGRADLLVGAVLVPGARAPRLISREMVQNMALGAVVVDVAIDQGGCIETIDRVTCHTDPTYLEYDVVHYAVPNIPAAVGRTATMALTNATLPYVLELAGKGWEKAVDENQALAKGINILDGSITNQGVAEALSEFLN